MCERVKEWTSSLFHPFTHSLLHSFTGCLHAEALAAAAHRIDVRVLELESLLQALFDEIECRALEEVEALLIDHHFCAVRFDKLVAFTNLVGVVVGVREPGTADFLHAHAKP